MSTENDRSALVLLGSREGVPTVLLAVAGFAASLAVFFAAYFWELRSIDEDFDSLANDRFRGQREHVRRIREAAGIHGQRISGRAESRLARVPRLCAVFADIP